MKRLIVFLIVTLFAFSFVACSGGGGDGGPMRIKRVRIDAASALTSNRLFSLFSSRAYALVTPGVDITVTYDVDGNVDRVTKMGGGFFKYNYSGGKIVSRDTMTNETTKFSTTVIIYDGNGNMSSATETREFDGVIVSRYVFTWNEYNDIYRVTSMERYGVGNVLEGTDMYSYDGDGELIGIVCKDGTYAVSGDGTSIVSYDGPGADDFTLEYDDFGRIIKFTKAEDSEPIVYQYTEEEGDGANTDWWDMFNRAMPNQIPYSAQF